MPKDYLVCTLPCLGYFDTSYYCAVLSDQLSQYKPIPRPNFAPESLVRGSQCRASKKSMNLGETRVESQLCARAEGPNCERSASSICRATRSTPVSIFRRCSRFRRTRRTSGTPTVRVVTCWPI